MCGIIPITEHYEEMAKAREEQREACARQLEATLSAYWPGREREIQSAMNVVRAMSLDSTPLADRIRELEASRELQMRLTNEALKRHKAELRRVAIAVKSACRDALRETSDECQCFTDVNRVSLDAILGGENEEV